MSRKVDYHTINADNQLGFIVYAWGHYPEDSVLAGQPSKQYVKAYDTLEEAQTEYPDAGMSSKWTEPQVSLNHLPGEDDPVPGGMYPDDYDDGY